MSNILLSWSGGKDSAMVLHRQRHAASDNIVGLLTTVTEEYGRISMHGIRRELLRRQAQSVGLDVTEVTIPADSSNEVYDQRMRNALTMCKRTMGINSVAFGDLFLQDIRRYREARLSEISLEAVFPLWNTNTHALAEEFIGSGFRALVCCVDTARLRASQCGREYDMDFINSLPPGVDPCGENGEFHTFVYDGPEFAFEIKHSVGEKVTRGGFCFADIIPL